jgi:radical SAM protein
MIADEYHERPQIVIWELTRACALACVHCRASAIPHRDPNEVSLPEAEALLEEIERFGELRPLLVLTGGDPLRWPDVSALVESATRRGIHVAATPSATGAVTRPKLQALRDAGLRRLAVSLDGPTAEAHDAFRSVKGSYAWTMKIIESARAIGLPLQINSSVTRQTYPCLDALAEFVTAIEPAMWALFFLVPTGRGRREDQISAWECEHLLNDLYDLAGRVPFRIKTTEAPHYRRVVLERNRGIRRDGRAAQLRAASDPHGSEERRQIPNAISDGKGFVFIDHVGEVYPSGVLPLPVGNVREASLVRMYREHSIFKALRDPERLEGQCGICPYREICGGSRARAYALRGNYLAEDSLCFYDPGNL